jgi:hypothetical protein
MTDKISWALYLGKTLITNQSICEDDKILVFSSFFNGPNIIIWLSKNPYMNFQLTMKDVGAYIFTYGKNYRIELCLNNYSWDSYEKCYRAFFITKLRYYLRQSLSGDSQVVAQSILTVEDGINAMIGEYPDIQFYADDKFKNKEICPESGIALNMGFLPFIAGIAEDARKEFLIGEKSIHIATFVGDKTLGPALASRFHESENRITTKTINGKEFVEFVGINQHPVRVGYCISCQEKVFRVVYTRYEFSLDLVESTIICTTNFSITEDELFQVIPQGLETVEMAANMAVRMNRAEIRMGLVKKDDGNIIEMNINHQTRDPQAIARDTKPAEGNMALIKSSPYAGNTVGLQFPVNIEAVSATENSSITAGQIFQKDSDGKLLSPKMESPNDFRLTLPDGGSLYYSNESGTFYMVGKNSVAIMASPRANYLTFPKDYIPPSDSHIIINYKMGSSNITIQAMDVSIGSNLTENTPLALSVKPHRHEYKHVHITSNGTPTIDPEIEPQPSITNESNMNTTHTKAN